MNGAVKFAVGAAILYKAVSMFIPVVKIIGDSMFPTYKDGERLLFHRVFRSEDLQIGDVVVLLNPRGGDHKYLIKRIYMFEFYMGLKNKVWVLGDNEGNSMDSREFGWVPIRDVKYVAFKSREREELA